MNKKKVTFKSINNKTLKIDPQNPEDLVRLEKEGKFVYDRKFNRTRTKVKLSIRPVNVLAGQFGVFAEQDIKASDNAIGCYAGKRVKAGHENINSMFIFEITDDDGKEIECIDGEKLRDWTNLVNHSATPNLDAVPRKYRGKINIYFYVTKPIKKGEQLLFDYGKSYFLKGMNHYFIHPRDTWLSPVEHYLEKQQYYLPGIYQFDSKLAKDLKLKQHQWLLPQLFLSIEKNNRKSLAQQLKSSHPVDLLAYALRDQHHMVKPEHQQHITPLMYAAYLGREECMRVLIEYHADVNRCMLIAGFMPFSLLCKGHASIETVERMGKKLLQKMDHPFVIDSDKRGILNYAIMRNSNLLVKLILKRIKDADEPEILVEMLKKEDLLVCLNRGNFTMLAMLFKSMKACAMAKPRFPASLLEALLPKNRILLYKLLKTFNKDKS